MDGLAAIGAVIAVVGLVGGAAAWMISLTFQTGRLYEQVQQMRDRLDDGDENFKEMRVEQTEMGKILAELTTIKKIELQRLNRVEQQVSHLWHRGAPAAAQQPQRQRQPVS